MAATTVDLHAQVAPLNRLAAVPVMGIGDGRHVRATIKIWGIHRAKLTASMRALQQKVHDTRQGFGQTDDDLRRQLASRTK